MLTHPFIKAIGILCKADMLEDGNPASANLSETEIKFLQDTFGMECSQRLELTDPEEEHILDELILACLERKIGDRDHLVSSRTSFISSLIFADTFFNFRNGNARTNTASSSRARPLASSMNLPTNNGPGQGERTTAAAT